MLQYTQYYRSSGEGTAAVQLYERACAAVGFLQGSSSHVRLVTAASHLNAPRPRGEMARAIGNARVAQLGEETSELSSSLTCQVHCLKDDPSGRSQVERVSLDDICVEPLSVHNE